MWVLYNSSRRVLVLPRVTEVVINGGVCSSAGVPAGSALGRCAGRFPRPGRRCARVVGLPQAPPAQAAAPRFARPALSGSLGLSLRPSPRQPLQALLVSSSIHMGRLFPVREKCFAPLTASPESGANLAQLPGLLSDLSLAVLPA